MFRFRYQKTYAKSLSTFANAQIGYAPDVGSVCHQTVTLRYLYLTWREVEPEETAYAWDTIDLAYRLAELRAQGLHLVLRFVCDFPGPASHLDIPDWLYAQTQDGSWYDTDYGTGYSPDYANPVFRAAHRRVIAALAAHFDDGFVSYVELGSLGHWGEWHIRSGPGLVSMPEEAIRDHYVQDYLDAFSHAKLLMRRPFRVAVSNDTLGLYNDMTGDVAGTQEWLRWIGYGGWYGLEPTALAAMPERWKTAPIGGELSSGTSMKELLDTNLSTTLELVRASHMSFLGPLSADEAFPAGYQELLRHLGYRLRVSRLQLAPASGGTVAALTLANEGATPFYWDWPARLYVETPDGRTLQAIPLPVSLPKLLPATEVSVSVFLRNVRFTQLLFQHSLQLTLGIVDPMTGRDAIRFAMKTAIRNGRAFLWS